MKEIEQRRNLALSSFVRPSAELKSSVDEINKSLDIANTLHIREYLDVINQEYLEGKGTITGPRDYISSDLIPKNTDDESRDVVLRNSYGGVNFELHFGESLENLLQIDVNYRGMYNWIDFTTYARYNAHRESNVTINSTLTRGFYINIDNRLESTVESLLLAFTEELIEGGIIK